MAAGDSYVVTGPTRDTSPLGGGCNMLIYVDFIGVSILDSGQNTY